MHANVTTRDLKTRRNNVVEEYNFVFSALCQKRNKKRGGINQKKNRKKTWVKKEDFSCEDSTKEGVEEERGQSTQGE